MLFNILAHLVYFHVHTITKHRVKWFIEAIESLKKINSNLLLF